VTGAWNEAAFASESEEARIEADQVAIVFGDGGAGMLERQVSVRPASPDDILAPGLKQAPARGEHFPQRDSL
jgi:hypothetical protein